MSVLENSFCFDEKAFQEYYLLHIKLRDDHVAFKRIILYLFLYLPLSFFPLWFVLKFGIFADGAKNEPNDFLFLGCFVAVFLFVVGCLIHSLYLARGRRINWGSKRWRARTELVFRHLKAGNTSSPIAKGIEYDFVPICFISGPASIGDKWHNEGVYFDIIPYLLPRFKKELIDPEKSCAPYAVEFTAQFFDDHIEKGKHGEVFAASYADIFDILDNEKFLHIAIIRHKDEKSELVLRKDGFGDIPWEVVRDTIVKRKRIAEGLDPDLSKEEFYGYTGSYQ